PQCFEGRERLPVPEANRLLLHSLRGLDRASPQTTFEEVDVRAGETGVRRAKVGVEIAPPAAEPREPEQCQQRLAERRSVKPQATLDRIGNAEGRERGLERRLPALDRRADDRDPVGGRSA